MNCWVVFTKNEPTQEWFLMRVCYSENEAAALAHQCDGIVVRGDDYRKEVIGEDQ